MKIRKSYLGYLLTYIILLFILFWMIYLQAGDTSRTILECRLGMLSIVSIIIFLHGSHLYTRRFFSISALFVIFFYLFNLGIPISRLFGWLDMGTLFTLNHRVYVMGDIAYIGFSSYSLALISCCELGILFFQSSHRYKKDLTPINLTPIQRAVTFKTGMTLIAIGVFPYLYTELLTIYYGHMYGYQSTANNLSLEGTGLGLFAGLFVLGIFILLISISNDKTKFDIVFFSFAVYQIIRMLMTGDRSTGIILIIVLVYLRHILVVPVRGFRLGILVFLSYFMLLLLRMIELTRHSTTMSILDVFSQVIQTNALSETINDYGTNVWSGLMLYYSVPATGHFRYGLTYLAGVIGKPLSILGITDNVWKFADFSNFLKEPARGTLVNQLTNAMGGSFSAEWYFNFSWIGILLIIVFGYFLEKFSVQCIQIHQHPIVAAFLLYTATNVIWWLRQYFSSVAWVTMFYSAILFFAFLIWNRSKNK